MAPRFESYKLRIGLVLAILLLIPLGPAPVAERAPWPPSLNGAAPSAPTVMAAAYTMVAGRDNEGRPYWEAPYDRAANSCIPIPLSWPMTLNNVDLRSFTNFTLTMKLRTSVYQKASRIGLGLTPEPFWTVAVNIAGLGIPSVNCAQHSNKPAPWSG
jgi:hypothetical protein